MSAEVGTAEYDEKLRKKKEEEASMWDEYMDQRKAARIKEEEDLKKLKERQARRKAQRNEHEKIMLEMRRKQEEQRQREHEEKREKEEEAKRKRLEEAERKRQQMQEALKKQREAAKRSFALNKKADGGVIGVGGGGGGGGGVGPDVNVASLGRSDIIKTKEQLAEEKKIAMQFRVKPLQIDNLGLEELKKKADELWEQIVQAESDRFDLEQRQARLDYELKTLEERAKQINRARAKRRGLDPEALTGKYPPKLQVASKYERRLDRRDFTDKKGLFEGGWDKLTKEEKEKIWLERINSFKETHGDKKVTKWDPSTLRQAREQDDQGRPIYDGDDDDDQDMMDAYKNFINKEENQQIDSGRRRSSAASGHSQPASRRASQQQQQVKEESEEEEEEEEIEEEEEVEEEEVTEEEDED